MVTAWNNAIEEGGGETLDKIASAIPIANGEVLKASNAASAPLFHWIDTLQQFGKVIRKDKEILCDISVPFIATHQHI